MPIQIFPARSASVTSVPQQYFIPATGYLKPSIILFDYDVGENKTFTSPINGTIRVFCVGPGGNGGYRAGSGGGGGYCEKEYTVEIGDEFIYTVGQHPHDGDVIGSSTVWNDELYATGGHSGYDYDDPDYPNEGGARGSASGGDINKYGGNGQYYTGTASAGGSAGNRYYNGDSDGSWQEGPGSGKNTTRRFDGWGIGLATLSFNTSLYHSYGSIGGWGGGGYRSDGRIGGGGSDSGGYGGDGLVGVEVLTLTY